MAEMSVMFDQCCMRVGVSGGMILFLGAEIAEGLDSLQKLQGF